MVLSKHATIKSQEWRKMRDYHPEGYLFRATLIENEYQYWVSVHHEIVPIDEINEQLKKWHISFKYETGGNYQEAEVRAYFFKTARELMRMRLTFAEYITETYQCKPRSQIEGDRRKEFRKKRKKDKTIMLADSQVTPAYVTDTEDTEEE